VHSEPKGYSQHDFVAAAHCAERHRNWYRQPLSLFSLFEAAVAIDHEALVRDRLTGISLTNVGEKYRISRASVVRVVREAKQQEMVAAA
jgi:hypothetical protein